MAMFEKMSMEAGGISRCAVMRLSMVRACWMAKLWLWDAEVTSRIPAPQMRSMRMIDLSSSTRCTVDSRHGRGTPLLVKSPSVTVAARSKKLKKEVLIYLRLAQNVIYLFVCVETS